MVCEPDKWGDSMYFYFRGYAFVDDRARNPIPKWDPLPVHPHVCDNGATSGCKHPQGQMRHYFPKDDIPPPAGNIYPVSTLL
jgi:hypothetical protein